MAKFLIDETYLKSTVNISLHKDAQEIKIALKTVEEFYMKDLLSLPLYEHYVTLISTTGSTMTEKEGELFNMVKLYYALMVQHELLFNLFTVSNKGNEQNPNAPSIQDVREKRTEVMSKAETVKTRILQYLNQYKTDFPLYFSATPSSGSLDESGFSPIVFY